VQEHDKTTMLLQLLQNINATRCVIITKSKKRADELASTLNANKFNAKAIHGNHKQELQEEVTAEFNTSNIDILITTDMILKSLEIKNVKSIVSYDLPSQKEHYASRLRCVDEIGESILLVNEEDERLLVALELAMKKELDDTKVENFEPTEKPLCVEKRTKKRKPRHKHTQGKKEDSKKV